VYDNSTFKVHFTGAIVCEPWLVSFLSASLQHYNYVHLFQTHDKSVKLGVILNTLVSQLTTTCSCQLSAKYISSGSLTCGDSTTDRVILQGIMVGALQSSSADLHTQLQSWVDTSPTVQVIGIPLQVVPCSTYPGGEASCELREPTGATPITIPRVDSEESSSSGLGGVTLYAAVGGGVAVLLVIAIVVILLILAVRRRRSKQFTPSRYLSATLCP
jgi:hypothetical protein